MATKKGSKGPLQLGANPPKMGGEVTPTNSMNGEKTIPRSARLQGLTGGPARFTKAGRGVAGMSPGKKSSRGK